MHPQQAIAFLDILRENYLRGAELWDLELMPSDRLDSLLAQNPLLKANPFFEAAWFGRQGAIVAVWSLWDCYSRPLYPDRSAYG
jgi:hypothetical protein